MSRLNQQNIVVVGAGVFGAVIALDLARAGARSVTVIDAAPLGRNASGIAAGMLAPAFEAALDPVSTGHFALLSTARDLWLPLVSDLGPTGLERCGALLSASPSVVEAAGMALRVQGAEAEVLANGALFTTEDWRLEPRLALASLRQGFLALGGQILEARVEAVGEGRVSLADGVILEADAIVLACGYGALHLAPELAVLSPIKGQLLRYPDVEMAEGPILRGASGYLTPGRDGPVCGATMEAGLSDTNIDPDAVARLKAQAVVLSPHLAGARASALAGVRASTPDGLPLVGASRIPGVWLAAGARRNGWLLAPMVARQLVRQMAGEDGGETAAFFAPDRFSSPG